MKRVILVLSLGLVLIVPQTVLALDLGADLTKRAAKKAGYSEATDETTFAATIGQVIKVAMSLIGILFTALMVYAGFLWMTARGEEGQIDKAKHIITYSIVGIIIALGSYSITAFVVPRVLKSTTGQDLGTVGAPAPRPEPAPESAP